MGSTLKPRLLWFDCTTDSQDAELRVQCARVFELAVSASLERAPDDIERYKPGVLCFDFDHPDQKRLRAMQAIKKAYPKLPILMLTVDHSESLAVWAFRARVWNYLVKPVSRAEFAENLGALARIGNRASPPRVAQLLETILPDDLPVQPVESKVAQLQPALHYVKQHYHDKISAAVAAEHCGVTRFAFSRKFHAAFGITFREYLLRMRITEACRLLAEGSLSITEVAYAVGFSDGSHFARMFRRYMRVLPSRYQPTDQRTADRRRSQRA